MEEVTLKDDDLVVRDITLLRDLERELRERNRFQNLIGRNKTMQDIYALLEDLANLETTVLVTGESGTGHHHTYRLNKKGEMGIDKIIINSYAMDENDDGSRYRYKRDCRGRDSKKQKYRHKIMAGERAPTRHHAGCIHGSVFKSHHCSLKLKILLTP